jgi:hypothetical protein
MIKGLAITPPVLGRISIGRVVERNGKRLPEKDDQFTITSQVQTKDGWVNHPIDDELRKTTTNGKIRSIPVRMLFNDPDLNLRAEYSLFDRQNGRPICVGNGEKCRRHTSEGLQHLDCPSPEHCEFAKGGLCKPYGRLNVKIGDDDELGTFIFRTTGFNSIRTLAARLTYYQAVSGNLLSCLPLQLRIRGKSTTQSHRTPIYYVDLTVREGMSLEESIVDANALNAKRQVCGFDQAALDQAGQLGFSNATFEDSEEEVAAIVEEYFTESGTDHSDQTHVDATVIAGHTRTLNSNSSSLKDKLNRKASDLGGQAA